MGGSSIAELAVRPGPYCGRIMAWPDHLPDGCPPEDAPAADGQVFRLVGEVPTADDFRSHFERDPDRRWSDLCLACGLSVHADVADAERTRQRFPALRSRAIAQGSLDASLGVMKPTGTRSHRTWWVTEDSEPWLVFEVTA